MYNTAYNRAIANEVNQINKRFVKHDKDIANMSGSGTSGGQEYIKNQPDICRHCEGSGVSGSGVSGSGVSGGKRRVGRPRKHEVEGKGGVGLNLPFGGFNVGWGHPEHKQMKGKGGVGLNLPFGGFNVGWGHPEHKQMKGKGGVGLNLPFGGFNVGWGKPELNPKKLKGKGTFGISVPGMGGLNVGWGKKSKKTEGKPKRHNPRAEIVKKVMKEQGLSMIEASKYVKKEHLY